LNFVNLPPLIVTLKFDDKSFEFFDRLRRIHFPPERNFLSAHITLFHHLPGAELKKIETHLIEICANFRNFPLRFTDWRFLGRGVAINIDAAQLISLHRMLSKNWNDWLTAQDRQKFQPHITVQNKVSPGEAKELHKNLFADWQQREGEATGLRLWHYLGREWKLERDFLFGSEA
jgi:2'-5' RNA ligase